MIDTLLSRGCNSVATASTPLSIVSFLRSCKNEFPEFVESLISMESLNLRCNVRVIYAAYGIMKCMFRKMFAEFITDLLETHACPIIPSDPSNKNWELLARFTYDLFDKTR